MELSQKRKTVRPTPIQQCAWHYREISLTEYRTCDPSEDYKLIDNEFFRSWRLVKLLIYSHYWGNVCISRKSMYLCHSNFSTPMLCVVVDWLISEGSIYLILT